MYINAMHAWAAYMSFECLEKCKLKTPVCVRVYTFDSVCVCVFPAGPPASVFPLSQCWDLRGPIKAGLPATPASPGPLR